MADVKINDLVNAAVSDTMQFETDIGGTTANKVLATAIRTYVNATDVEDAQDAVGTILTDTATVDFTYSDATPSITADVIDNSITNAKLRTSSGMSVVGRGENSTGNVADITAANDNEVLRRSGTSIAFGTVATGGLENASVTYAKIQDVATDRLLGRDTASSGVVEELTAGGGIEFTGTGIQTSAFTGDVTKSAGGTAQTIANDAV
ncbi:MAG: hypothetical protein ACRDEA_22020, partial [Microcystaceae cyanobacterium]